MESGFGAPGGEYPEPTRPVCRYAHRQPTVHDAGQWVSDGLSGLFCPVSVWPADRSALRSGDATEYMCEQPLQRTAVDGRETDGAWAAGARQLHLEPLYGHGLERWIPALFSGWDCLAAARRSAPAVWALRLRCPAELHCQLCLRIAFQSASSAAGFCAEWLADFGLGVLA